MHFHISKEAEESLNEALPFITAQHIITKILRRVEAQILMTEILSKGDFFGVTIAAMESIKVV